MNDPLTRRILSKEIPAALEDEDDRPDEPLPHVAIPHRPTPAALEDEEDGM